MYPETFHHAALPLASPMLWARFLLGLALVAGLPGYLLLGRLVKNRVLVPVASLAVGLVWVPIAGCLLDLAGVPFGVLGFSVLTLAAVAASWFGLRRVADAGTEIANAWTANTSPWWPLLASVVLAGGLLASFGDFSAPPHLHDASNHAYLTRQIVVNQTIHPRELLESPMGAPESAYLVGWHATAALVAQVTHVAPYVTTWMLPLLLVALTPWSLAVLWSLWGFSRLATGFATCLAMANAGALVGVLGWGGFSAAAGTFLVPWVTALLALGLARKSRTFALLAGATLGSLMMVQAASAMVALVLAIVTCFACGWRPRMASVLIMVGVLLLVFAPSVWDVAGEYRAVRVGHQNVDATPFGQAVNGWLNSLGRWHLLKPALLAGLVLGFAMHRAIVVASLLFGALFLSLSSLRDPFSLAMTEVFYQEASRVRSVQLFLLTPLAGLAVAWLVDRTRNDSMKMLAAAVLAVAMVAPALPPIYESLRQTRSVAPFTVEDYKFAQKVSDMVRADAWIVNVPRDGSVWMGHVANRLLTSPAAWAFVRSDGVSLRNVARDLAEGKSTDATALLRDHGVNSLIVSDDRLAGSAWSDIDRARFRRPGFIESWPTESTSLFYVE